MTTAAVTANNDYAYNAGDCDDVDDDGEGNGEETIVPYPELLAGLCDRNGGFSEMGAFIR